MSGFKKGVTSSYSKIMLPLPRDSSCTYYISSPTLLFNPSSTPLPVEYTQKSSDPSFNSPPSFQLQRSPKTYVSPNERNRNFSGVSNTHKRILRALSKTSREVAIANESQLQPLENVKLPCQQLPVFLQKRYHCVYFKSFFITFKI